MDESGGDYAIMHDMAERVAIITGAGRGIGRATATELAKREFRLVLISRNEADLRETAQVSDREAMIAVADVTDAQKLRAVVDQAVGKFGRIDAVVNNAGLAPVRTIEEMTVDEWRSVIDTNLSAAFYLAKAVWPVFKKQNGGVIVDISSAAARDPFPGFAAYGSAKAGLNLLGLSLAREGAPINVRVHTVAPAAVETAMFRTLLSPEQYPTEKTLAPADVASVVADCITGPLAHTSGQVIWLSKTV